MPHTPPHKPSTLTRLLLPRTQPNPKQSPKKSTQEEEKEEHIDLIDPSLYTKVQSCGRDGTRGPPSQKLDECLDDTKYGATGGLETYKNPHGLPPCEGYDEPKAKTDQIEAKLEALQLRYDKEILELRAKVDALSIYSQGYRRHRHIFLGSHNIEDMPDRELAKRKHPCPAWHTPQDADCAADAGLYALGERMDGQIFTRVYGTTWEHVYELGKQKNHACLKIINQFAELNTDPYRTEHLPKPLVNAYSTFINKLRLHGGGDVGAASTTLGRAHNTCETEFAKYKKFHNKKTWKTQYD